MIVYDDGEQIRCFAHVKEVVSCVIQLTEHPETAGKVFNIGSDRPIKINELAAAVVAKINPRVEIVHRPYEEAYGLNFEDVRRRVPDVSRLEGQLGTKPSMNLGEILDDIIRWKKSSMQTEIRS